MYEFSQPEAIGCARHDDVGEDGLDVWSLLQDQDGGHTRRCLKNLKSRALKDLDGLPTDVIFIFDYENRGIGNGHISAPQPNDQVLGGLKADRLQPIHAHFPTVYLRFSTWISLLT